MSEFESIKGSTVSWNSQPDLTFPAGAEWPGDVKLSKKRKPRPLRCYFLVCRKPYPKIGEELVLRDKPEAGYDYKLANWGTNFEEDLRDAVSDIDFFGSFQEEYYPHAIVLTTSRNIVRAIIPITQHKEMPR